MPSIEKLNERLMAEMKHDKSPQECVGCPNLKVDTTPLGRQVLSCALLESMETEVWELKNSVARGEDPFEQAQLKVSTLKTIIDGEEPKEVEKRAISSRPFSEGSINAYGEGEYRSQLQWVVTSLLVDIEQANDDCPVLDGVISQIIDPRSTPNTKLKLDDPIIRPE